MGVVRSGVFDQSVSGNVPSKIDRALGFWVNRLRLIQFSVSSPNSDIRDPQAVTLRAVGIFHGGSGTHF